VNLGVNRDVAQLFPYISKTNRVRMTSPTHQPKISWSVHTNLRCWEVGNASMPTFDMEKLKGHLYG
jgi:hypothetical protein